MTYENPIPKLLKHPFRLLAVIRMILLWIRLYFTTQDETDVEAAVVIETNADDRIPIDQLTVYPYLFASIYILYVCWVVVDRLSKPHYKSTHKAFQDMILEAQRVFRDQPTRMRTRTRSTHPLLRFTQEVDGPTNCYPSLHVALVMLSYQIVKDLLSPGELLHHTMKQSCIDICRSTMQTKQHSMIDVMGGIMLSRMFYERSFTAPFEDFLGAILPELTPSELASARAVMDEFAGNLVGARQVLWEMVSSWS